MRRIPLLLIVALAAVLTLTPIGCGKKGGVEALEPKLAPPVIGEAGVLRAGIDLGYPPFGAVVDGEEVGLDVDMAAALAERLGLKLEIVSTTPTETPAVLAERSVDVVLAGLPLSDELLTEVTFAGSYIDDAPAFFASDETSYSTPTLGGKRPGVQQGSLAYWTLERELGSQVASAYPTVREAFGALESGQLEVVAADAVVGAYLARDFASVRFAGQLMPAVPLGVAIAKDSGELESAIRGALDEMAADGTLEAIRAKWVDDLPELATSSAEGD